MNKDEQKTIGHTIRIPADIYKRIKKYQFKTEQDRVSDILRAFIKSGLEAAEKQAQAGE